MKALVERREALAASFRESSIDDTACDRTERVTLIKAGEYARQLGISAAEVRELANWQLVKSTRDGNVLHIHEPAPDREELLGLLRRAIRGQSRLVLEALIKVNTELGAIRNDVQEIRDAIDQEDDEMVIKLGPELRDIWSTRSPAREAMNAATLPQMELMAMIKILGSLNDRALSAPLRWVPLDEPGVAPRMSREARAQRDAEIIERYAAGDPPAALAAEFSLTRARVHQIVARRRGSAAAAPAQCGVVRLTRTPGSERSRTQASRKTSCAI
jgi:hypothetical protein